MIKEALQFLFEESQAHIHRVHELPFADKELTIIKRPIGPCVEVETLGALVKLSESGIDGLQPEDSFAQVDNHFCVTLTALNADEFGRRRNFVQASIEENSRFKFGSFMDPEEFVIGLQSNFVEDAALRSLLQTSSSLTAENVAIAEDDGISQRATIRQGVSLKENRKIEPKIKLRPYRTFREVEQPASTFLFRLRNRENAPPLCALFEADGGAWKLEAARNVATFLRDELPKNVQVIF
ncbi:MAG TPA: hypothetical protein VND65_19635 [Candidatus Binatia bacterium]|nr:hypothetical protein [Candidatus Binatia bacterium]